MPPHQLTFDLGDDGPPDKRPAPLPRIAPLAARLRKLADRGIYLGTSSWKYPGWIGQVYDADRYQYRGKFSEKRFNRDCLAEYAAVFPTVGGDLSFYQFPSPDMWREMMHQVPDGFRFSLKAPEDMTVPRWPDLPRYGRRAGEDNPHFLDAGLIREKLLAPLEPHRDKLGVIIFEFGTFHRPPLNRPQDFAAALDAFLSALPLDRFRFAVEVRNPEFLEDGEDYLACLRAHGVAHCLNSWTRMPSLAEQLRHPAIFTDGVAAARLLLRPGRAYQQAVDRFAPYDRLQEPYPEGRTALRELIERCLAARRLLYAFVNNRFEGNAPQTIEDITEGLD